MAGTTDGTSAATRQTMRPVRSADAEQARTRILAAASAQFRERGYDRTSLADVGAAAGLTGGAVLYHFKSKANLLHVLLTPFTQALDEQLTQFEKMDQPPTPEAIVEAVLVLMTRNRSSVVLLSRDPAIRGAVGFDSWVASRARRLMYLLAPTTGNELIEQIRGYAALGAILRPLTHLSAPVGEQEHDAILAAALGALGVLRTAEPPEGTATADTLSLTV